MLILTLLLRELPVLLDYSSIFMSSFHVIISSICPLSKHEYIGVRAKKDKLGKRGNNISQMSTLYSLTWLFSLLFSKCRLPIPSFFVLDVGIVPLRVGKN